MELLNETISALLFAVITAAVPILAKAAITAINQWIAKVQAEIEDTKVVTESAAQKELLTVAGKYYAQLMEIVTASVDMVSQTYVDSLKDSGTFTPDAQKKAFTDAYDNVTNLMTEDMENVLGKIYDDIPSLIKTLIEATVKNNKDGIKMLTASYNE